MTHTNSPEACRSAATTAPPRPPSRRVGDRCTSMIGPVPVPSAAPMRSTRAGVSSSLSSAKMISTASPCSASSMRRTMRHDIAAFVARRDDHRDRGRSRPTSDRFARPWLRPPQSHETGPHRGRPLNSGQHYAPCVATGNNSDVYLDVIFVALASLGAASVRRMQSRRGDEQLEDLVLAAMGRIVPCVDVGRPRELA